MTLKRVRTGRQERERWKCIGRGGDIKLGMMRNKERTRSCEVNAVKGMEQLFGARKREGEKMNLVGGQKARGRERQANVKEVADV
jgi:hypothetical protein